AQAGAGPPVQLRRRRVELGEVEAHPRRLATLTWEDERNAHRLTGTSQVVRQRLPGQPDTDVGVSTSGRPGQRSDGWNQPPRPPGFTPGYKFPRNPSPAAANHPDRLVLLGPGGRLVPDLLDDGGVGQGGDVAELALLGHVLEEAAHDLARAGLGQVGGEDEGGGRGRL